MSALESKIEAACDVTEDPNFYTTLDELQDSHTELLEKGLVLVANAHEKVDEGIAWVEEVSAESEEAAQKSEHFMTQLTQARAGLTDMGDLMTYEKNRIFIVAL